MIQLTPLPDCSVTQHRSTGGGWVLEAAQELCRPRGEVFAFFAEAANLQLLTPPWVGFRFLTPLPVQMGVGTLIDYRISIRGLPLRWRTRIAVWEPPERFVDEQVRGPYRCWVHEHRFADRGTHTGCQDRVEYDLRGGRLLAALQHGLMVGRDVRRIFVYRAQELARRFPDPDAAGPALTLP
jgi:ligand-binding SRPBCC domain-containing protein